MTAALTHVPAKKHRSRNSRRSTSGSANGGAQAADAATPLSARTLLQTQDKGALAANVVSRSPSGKAVKSSHPTLSRLIDTGGDENKWDHDKLDHNVRLDCAEALWKYIVTGTDIPDLVRIQLAPMLRRTKHDGDSTGRDSIVPGISDTIAEGNEDDSNSYSDSNSGSDSGSTTDGSARWEPVVQGYSTPTRTLLLVK